jgi:hypothetical protein
MAPQDHGQEQPKEVSENHAQEDDVPMPGIKGQARKDGGGIQDKKYAEDQVEDKNGFSSRQKSPLGIITQVTNYPPAVFINVPLSP